MALTKDCILLIFDFIIRETRWQPEPFTQLCLVAKWVRKHLRQKYPFVLQFMNKFKLNAFQRQLVDDCWYYMNEWLHIPADKRKTFVLFVKYPRRVGFSFMMTVIGYSLEKFHKSTWYSTIQSCEHILPDDDNITRLFNHHQNKQVYLIENFLYFKHFGPVKVLNSNFIITSTSPDPITDIMICKNYNVDIEHNTIGSLACKKQINE